VSENKAYQINDHYYATTEGGAAMTMTNANRRGRQFTPERVQQIRNLVERGKSREEIAELIGVTLVPCKTPVQDWGLVCGEADVILIMGPARIPVVAVVMFPRHR
jgi:hypothetical protein